MSYRSRHQTWNWRNEEANGTSRQRYHNRRPHHSHGQHSWSGQGSRHWQNDHHFRHRDYHRSANEHCEYGSNYKKPLLTDPPAPNGFGVFVGSWYMDVQNSAHGKERMPSVQNGSFSTSLDSSERQKGPRNTGAGNTQPTESRESKNKSGCSVEGSSAKKLGNNPKSSRAPSCSGNAIRPARPNIPVQKQSKADCSTKQPKTGSGIVLPSSSPLDVPATGNKSGSSSLSDHSTNVSPTKHRAHEVVSKSDAEGKSSGRPKLDLKACKRKSSTLSKEDLMKLISSPRSRQERIQLNRILSAHAERQKSSIHHTSASESEGLELPFDGSGVDIEAVELPPEIQGEIGRLCEGIVGDLGCAEGRRTGGDDVESSGAEGVTEEDVVVIESVDSQRRANKIVPAACGVRGQGQVRVSESLSQKSHSPGVTGKQKPGHSSDHSVPSSPAIAASTVLLPCGTEPQASAVTESQIAEDGMATTVLQISLCEESIQRRLKDVESEISTLESEMSRLKEKLKSKLNLQLKLVEEKLTLRQFRLQLLKDSYGLGHEPSTAAAVLTIPEAMSHPGSIVAIEPAAPEGENACDGNFALNCDHGDSFSSVLRDGFINIEPIDDGVALGCEDETLGRLQDCFLNENTIPPITIAPVGDDSADTDAAHPEYAGTVDPLSLQPQVLREIARSFQSQNISNGVANSNSVNEFSCSEDETVEPDSHAGSTAEISGAKDKTRNVSKSGKKSRTSAKEDLDDCVISRVDKRGSKSLGHSTGDGEVVVVSADVSSSHQRSGKNFFSNPGVSALSSSPSTSSNNAVFINLDTDPHEHSMPASVGVGSSSAVSTTSEKRPNFGGKTVGAKKTALNKTPVLSPSNKASNRKKSATPNSAASSCRISKRNTSTKSSGSAVTAPALASNLQNRPSENDFETRVTAGVRCGNNQHLLTKAGSNTGCLDGGYQWTSGNVQTLKRKSACKVDGPQQKRKKLKAKTFKTKGQQKSQKWELIKVNPSASVGVLYRHVESVRSVILSDEVIVTTSDDGQIIQHQIPRMKYGQAEKLTFAGHATGVVGLILAQYRVSQQITKAVIISIGRDQVIKMHCLQTGKVMLTHKFNKGICYDCISEAGGTVFIGLEDGGIARLATTTFAVKEPFAYASSSRVSALATCSGSKRHLLLIGFGDCTISVRDSSSNALIQTLRGHVRAPRFLLMLDKCVVSSSGDCSVFVHSLKGSEPAVNTLYLPFPVVAVATKDNMLLVATKNRTITCIDIHRNQRYIILFTGIEHPLTCVVASNFMVYFGCSNGFVYHADVDMRKHWKCGFEDCKDWFFWKGDLETHIKEDHSTLRVPVMIHGQYQSPCGWQGCADFVSQAKANRVLSHYLKHLRELEPEETVLGQSLD